jgi:hypothetical protein
MEFLWGYEMFWDGVGCGFGVPDGIRTRVIAVKAGLLGNGTVWTCEPWLA